MNTVACFGENLRWGSASIGIFGAGDGIGPVDYLLHVSFSVLSYSFIN